MSVNLWQCLAIPGLLWVAIRYGRMRVLVALGALALVATTATAAGRGPFASGSAIDALIQVTVWFGVLTLTSLAVAHVAEERKKAEARLLELSETDALTGLGNYRRLLDVLRTEIARSDRTKRPFAVLVVDVDGLNRINDSHGYLAGSRALIRVSAAIRRCCRTTDVPARFGGDEFAVVVTETDRVGAERLLTRVTDVLRASDEKPPVVVHGGIAAYPADGGTPGKLLSVAGEIRRGSHADRTDLGARVSA